MTLTKRFWIIIISLGAIFSLVAVAVGTPFIVISLKKNNAIKLTLLDNAGVMIEAKGMRIYIDPVSLPGNYSAYPADAILITHDHGDHCQSSVISMLQKEDTVNVFPKIMTSYISIYDGIGVEPEDQLQVGPIDITAFYMYTLPVGAHPASHPKETNYTSYIIDINGFTIFHAGDSKNIDEYDELTGLIDVALLPLGPGCQTMADMEVVDVIHTIQPQYFIPIHYGEGACEAFIASYGSLITDCQLMYLAYFESFTFK